MNISEIRIKWTISWDWHIQYWQ